MLSLKSALIFACIAFAAASPFFAYRGERNREGNEREGPEPLNQMAGQAASPSYDYGAGGAGAGTEPDSQSNEVADGGSIGGSIGGGETVDADGTEIEAGENEAAENAAAAAAAAGAAAAAAEADRMEAAEAAAGGSSGPGSANNLGGGHGHVANKGQKSATGRNAGIAVGVVAAVGLAAGCGFYVYRKKRAAAYGARF